jgi:hypothetical protein
MSEPSQLDPASAQPPDDHRPPAGSRSSDRSDLILAGVAVLALGGGLAWWGLGRTPAPPPAPPPAVAAAPVEAPAPTGPPAAAAPVPPPAEQGALLDATTHDATLRKLLSGDDLAERAAAVVANLAGGHLPRKLLEPLVPGKPFAVLERDGRTLVDPASYRRYDGFAAAVRGVDARAAAVAWRALHPALEVAWKALGEPEASVDKALARALSRLESAPLEPGELALVPPPDAKGALWQYADPALEALPGLEKQVLRLGPANGRIVKSKAAELRAALGLPLVKAGR